MKNYFNPFLSDEMAGYIKKFVTGYKKRAYHFCKLVKKFIAIFYFPNLKIKELFVVRFF